MDFIKPNHENTKYPRILLSIHKGVKTQRSEAKTTVVLFPVMQVGRSVCMEETELLYWV